MSRDYFFAFGSGSPATNASLTPTFITFANSSGTTFTAPSISEKPPGSGLYTVNYGATQTMAFIMDGATSGLATTDRYISGVFDPYDQFGITLNAAYALGVSNIAIGNSNIALGNSNLAIGITNLALDTLTFAQGTSSIALGVTTVSYGVLGLAIGTSNIALGNSNIALGITNLALDTLTFAQGATLFALSSAGNTIMVGTGTTLIAQGVTLVAMGNTLLGVGSSFGGLAAILGTTASPIGTSSVDPSDIMGYLRRLREYNEGNRIYTKATGLLDFYARGGATLLIEKTISDNSTQTTKT